MKLMQPSTSLLFHSLFALCIAAGGAPGCASDVDLGTRPNPMDQTGGTGASDQGMTGGSSGNPDASSGGIPSATGGGPDMTGGGDASATGGNPSMTGGSGGSDNHDEGSGGHANVTGGAPGMTGSGMAVGGGPAMAGGSDATGGGPAMTGGSMNASGGSPDATGGAPAMGFCGDGVVNAGEACDDGNDVSGDGCSATCTVEIGWRCDPPGAPCIDFPNCGNGVVDDGEACDEGQSNTGSYGGCNTDCTLAPYCGDGVIQMDHEQCDPGMNFAGSGCTADCQLG